MFYREVGEFKNSYAADQVVFPIRQDRYFVWAVVLFAFIGVPYLANPYWFRAILIPFLILSLAALGLNLLVGYCGQISLGTGGFMAVGAYAAYNLALRVPGLNPLVAFLLAGGIATLVGVLFGIPSLRIKGFYLAVATLAAQFFIDWVFSRIAWFTNYTPSGSLDAPAITLFGLRSTRRCSKYLLVSRVRDAFALLAHNLVRGRIGRSWMAISRHGRRRRDHRHPPAVGEALGVRGQLVLHRRGGGAVGVRPPGLVGAARLRRQPLVQPALHGHHRRAGLHPGQLPRRGVHRDAAVAAEPVPRMARGPIVDGDHLAHGIDDFGALIVFFLIVEPLGLARLWASAKEKLRLWPFPH